MKATTLLQMVTAFALIVVGVACSSSPMAPHPSTDPGSQHTTITVGDGWSQLPVAGAAVTVSGTQALTDAAGQAQFAGTMPGCVTADVTANGFLARQTCTTADARQITLWPIANADEGEVTRHWIFYNDRIERGRWSDPIQVFLGPQPPAEVV